MKPQITLESSTKFARILAEENVSVTFSSVAKTASINVLTHAITLPTYAADLDVNQLEGFILHETSHALHTPADYLELVTTNHDIPAAIFNICEDNRIERLMKAKYDGAVDIFAKKYKKCFFDIKEGTDKNWFGCTPETVNDLDLPDRINILSKAGQLAGVILTSEEQVFFDAINSANTFDEMIPAALSLWDFFNAARKEQPKSEEEADGCGESSSEQSMEAGDSDESESDADNMPDFEPSDEDEKSEETDDSAPDAEAEGTTDDTEESEETAADEKTEDNSAPDENSFKGNDVRPENDTSADADDEWDSVTEDALDDNLRENKSSSHDFTSSIPTLNAPVDRIHDVMYINKKVLEEYATLVNDRGDTVRRAFHTKPQYVVGDAMIDDMVKTLHEDAKRDVAALVSTFRIKQSANNVSRTKKFKTGEINEDELSNYKITDDIFLSDEITSNQQNHAFYSFIDLSGSMIQRDSCKKFSEEQILAEDATFGYTDIAKNAEEYRSDYSLQCQIVSKLTTMETRIYNVLKQAFVNALFCKELNLPFKTVGFTSGAVQVMYNTEEKHKNTPNYVKWADKMKAVNGADDFSYDYQVSLIELFTSDYTLADMLKTVHLICHDVYCNFGGGKYPDQRVLSFGGTPGSLALYSSINDIADMKTRYGVENVVVNYLSDGDSSACGMTSKADKYHTSGAKIVFDLNSKKYLLNPSGSDGAAFGLIHLAVLALKAKVANCTFIQFSAIGIPNQANSFNPERYNFKTTEDRGWRKSVDSVDALKKVFHYIVPSEYVHPAIDKQYMILIPSLNETDDIDAAVEKHATEKKTSQRAMVNYTLKILDKKAKLRAASKLLNLDLIKLVA